LNAGLEKVFFSSALFEQLPGNSAAAPNQWTVKGTAKILAEGLARFLVLPCYLGYRLSSLVFGPVKAFPGWSQSFSLIPGLSGAYLRRAFYGFVFPRCGAHAHISFGTIFSSPTAEVGRGSYIGPFCCLGDVTLEDDVLLSSHVSIANGGSQHGTDRLDIPVRDQPGVCPRITIGRDTWVGERAVIMADVGKHCIIGAGSVVTRPIPDYAIAVGVPAKVIRYRDGANAFSKSEPLNAPTSS
jgi:acetyltransferase-like isoleucine patch superfamily enzyme